MVYSQMPSGIDKDFIKKVNHALRQRKSLPSYIQADWNDIIEELSETAPEWETVKESISYTRKRG